MTDAVWQTDLPGLPAPKRGKVRDVYDLGDPALGEPGLADTMMIVACDRISAYDHVLRPAIPGKGKVLNQLTNFWFEHLADAIPNHLLATDVDDFPAVLRRHAGQLRGRAVLVRKAAVVPFECVARGFLAGSAFKEYRAQGTACGLPLPAGLVRASRLPEAIFTPATKAENGHDENVDFETLVTGVGEALAERLREVTLTLYRRGAAHAERQGLLLADTKFELGHLPSGELILIDEVLTPDSSRYWEAAAWRPGTEPVSFDKQYVRNWLDAGGWDHEGTPPPLPDDVVEGTLERYVEAFRRITGREPAL